MSLWFGLVIAVNVLAIGAIVFSVSDRRLGFHAARQCDRQNRS